MANTSPEKMTETLGKLVDKIALLETNLESMSGALKLTRKDFDESARGLLEFSRSVGSVAASDIKSLESQLKGAALGIGKLIKAANDPNSKGSGVAAIRNELQVLRETQRNLLSNVKQIKLQDVVDLQSFDLTTSAGKMKRAANLMSVSVKMAFDEIGNIVETTKTKLDNFSPSFINLNTIDAAISKIEKIRDEASQLSSALGTLDTSELEELAQKAGVDVAVINKLHGEVVTLSSAIGQTREAIASAFTGASIQAVNNFDRNVDATTWGKYQTAIKSVGEQVQALGIDGAKFVQDYQRGTINLTTDVRGLDARYLRLGRTIDVAYGIQHRFIDGRRKEIDGQERLNKAIQTEIDKKKAVSDLQERTKQTKTAVDDFKGTLPAPKNLSGSISRQEGLDDLTAKLIKYKGEIPSLVQLLQGLRNGTIPVTEANVALARSLEKLTATVPIASNRLKDLRNSVDRTRTQMQVFGKFLEFRLISQVFYAFTSQLRTSVNEMIEFGTTVAQIQSIGQKQPLVFNQWADALRNLSTEFNLPALDVAKGAYEALSNQIAEGTDIIKFSADAAILAKAAVGSQADAVSVLSSEINSFNLSAQAAARLNDELFRGVDLGRFKISDLGNSYGHTTVLAGQLGLSTGELTAAMTTLTRLGVPVSEAQTQITNVLNKMLTPTKEMTHLYEKMGVVSGQAAIQTFGFTGFLERLAVASEGGANQLEDLFKRIQAFKGALALTGFFDQYKRDLKDIENAEGSAAKAAEIIMTSHAQIIDTELTRLQNNLAKEVELWGMWAAEVQKFLDLTNQGGKAAPGLGDWGAYLFQTAAVVGSLALIVSLFGLVDRATNALGIGVLKLTGKTANLDVQVLSAASKIGFLRVQQELASASAAKFALAQTSVATATTATGVAATGAAAATAAATKANAASAAGAAATTKILDANKAAAAVTAVSATQKASGSLSGSLATVGSAVVGLVGTASALVSWVAILFGVSYAAYSFFNTFEVKRLKNIVDDFKDLNKIKLDKLDATLNKTRKLALEFGNAFTRSSLGVLANTQSQLNSEKKVIDEAFTRLKDALKSGYKSLTADQRKNLEESIDIQVKAASARLDRAVLTKRITSKEQEANVRYDAAKDSFSKAEEFAKVGDKEQADKFFLAALDGLNKVQDLMGRRINLEEEFGQVEAGQLKLRDQKLDQDYAMNALALQRIGLLTTIDGFDSEAEQRARINVKLISQYLDEFEELTKTPKSIEEIEAAADKIYGAMVAMNATGNLIAIDAGEQGTYFETFADLLRRKEEIAKAELALQKEVTGQVELQQALRESANKKQELTLRQSQQAAGVTEAFADNAVKAQVSKYIGLTTGAFIGGTAKETTDAYDAAHRLSGSNAGEIAAKLKNALILGNEKEITDITTALTNDLNMLNKTTASGGTQGSNFFGAGTYAGVEVAAKGLIQYAKDYLASQRIAKIEDPQERTKAIEQANAATRSMVETASGLQEATKIESEIATFKEKNKGAEAQSKALEALQDGAAGKDITAKDKYETPALNALTKGYSYISPIASESPALQAMLRAEHLKDPVARDAAKKKVIAYYNANPGADTIYDAMRANRGVLPVSVEGTVSVDSLNNVGDTGSYAPPLIDGSRPAGNSTTNFHNNVQLNGTGNTGMTASQMTAFNRQQNRLALQGVS